LNSNGSDVPLHYHINKEDEFITIRLEGDADLALVYELCQTLLNDPDYHAEWPQLVDVRGIELGLKRGAMRPFSRYVLTTYRPRVTAPIAVVIDGSMDDAFCAGVFRFVCSMPDAEVFDDYPLAIRWLVRKSVPFTDGDESTQPQHPDRYQPDEHPKQIRA
jgi:hypothetical protein